MAPETNIIKEVKWHPLCCCCHDNSYAAGPVLIKTKIPRFYIKHGSFTCNKLMRSFKTIWESCAFRARPSAPVKKIANGDIWFFTERDWSQDCCHSNNIVGVILFLLWCTFLVPSLKINALIFLEIFLIECCTVLVKPPMTSSLPSFAKYKNVNISKTKKDISKRKAPFFFTLKSLSNKQLLFLRITYSPPMATKRKKKKRLKPELALWLL